MVVPAKYVRRNLGLSATAAGKERRHNRGGTMVIVPNFVKGRDV